MKTRTVLLVGLAIVGLGLLFFMIKDKHVATVQSKVQRPDFVHLNELAKLPKKDKKTAEYRAQFDEARIIHELHHIVDPVTGVVPKGEVLRGIQQAKRTQKRKESTTRAPGTNTILSRGPSNLGGRTRSIAFDLSDATSQTIFAGGISGGLFKTTNGGSSWAKISPDNAPHNVTTIAQDPRVGQMGTWYYGTGEWTGNSASAFLSVSGWYFGQGIWESTDGGSTWTQMPSTNSVLESFDSDFDLIMKMQVHPVSGHLFVACNNAIKRWDGSTWTDELSTAGAGFGAVTDLVITSTGRVFAAIEKNDADSGVYTSPTGNADWTKIAGTGSATTPAGWAPTGRIVLANVPSNEDKLYALYNNGQSSNCTGSVKEADLFMWNQGTSTWTDYSGKLPDEGGCAGGNDPFSIQGAYDLVISVKPDNENFVVIGGTNAYKIANISTDAMFSRIGGYATATGYSKYANHHPDLHALVFDPNNSSIMLSGSDGGVHRTANISAATVAWTNLNNNYQTHQFYHVAISPTLTYADAVLGGAQDNGSTAGGTSIGLPNITTMAEVNSGDGAAVAISSDDACLPFFTATQNGAIYRDCPGVFETITPTGSSSQFVTYFYMDPDNNNILYYAGQDMLYRTTTSSSVAAGTWTNMGDVSIGARTDWIRSMATTRGTYTTNSHLFIGGDEGGIYRIKDPTGVATNIDISPPGVARTYPNIVSGIAVHPDNQDIVMAVYSNYGQVGVWLTQNATAATPTWTNVERNLSAPSIRSCAIIATPIAKMAATTDLYVIGTAMGVYSSDDPTLNDWVQEGVSSIGYSLATSMALRTLDQTLLIGTHGNGMYQLNINEPLPVEMVDFTGRLVGKEVHLQWNTASEYENKGFEVQRSLDGSNFTSIGFVEGAGTATQPRQYDFVDRQLKGFVQYYRLRQVDFEGEFEISKTVVVKTEQEGGSDFALYPNPARDFVELNFDRPINEEVGVKLLDVSGKLIADLYQDEVTERTLRIDLNTMDLSKGMYFINVQGEKGLNRTQPFMKL